LKGASTRVIVCPLAMESAITAGTVPDDDSWQSPGVSLFRLIFRMTGIELTSLDDLYRFVDSALVRTGLILDSAAQHRPWARTLIVDCREIEWYFPIRALPDSFLDHLSNFLHGKVAEKGIVLIERGRVVGTVDVDAVNGSNSPHLLSNVIRRAFEPKQPKRSSRPSGARRMVQTDVAVEDPYEVLGVSATDAPDEIKSKYKQLIMQYHPDRVSHLGPELIEFALRKTKEINEAYALVRKDLGE
jgi:hypothetical protein